MSGIYVHIPFCKQRCHYCDFYSSIQLNTKTELIRAICSELIQRKKWLKNTIVSTIYFGGGTPSLLSKYELMSILDTIFGNYQTSEKLEITLEANPDDLDKKKVDELKNTPFNRLSIGIQSFIDQHLQLMNRRHTAKEAIKVVKMCQEAGFSNLSGDLIYALPSLSEAEWKFNLNSFKELGINHLSAYHLTFEPKTVFGFLQKKGKLLPITENKSIKQFEILTAWAKQENFIHYEISNFAKKGFVSKHNSSYWFQKKYLGVGPSAHSFNGNLRTWNFSDIKTYIKTINVGGQAFENECLSIIDKHNEYLITRLRTNEGINLQQFEKKFGQEKREILLKQAKKFIETGLLFIENKFLILSNKGMLISDAILSEIILLN